MTKFNYTVEHKEDGCYVTVVRLEDKAERCFFLAGGRSDHVIKHCMDLITDDQAGDYFPKEKKEKIIKVKDVEPKPLKKEKQKPAKPPKLPKMPQRVQFEGSFKDGVFTKNNSSAEEIEENFQKAMVDYNLKLEEYNIYKESLNK